MTNQTLEIREEQLMGHIPQPQLVLSSKNLSSLQGIRLKLLSFLVRNGMTNSTTIASVDMYNSQSDEYDFRIFSELINTANIGSVVEFIESNADVDEIDYKVGYPKIILK